jgi:hypothetical protein
MPRNISVKRK